MRENFFSASKSLGRKPLVLTRQSDLDARFKKYVENSYWVNNQFLFVNLHIPGSNNNFERDEDAKAEYAERNQANLDWIRYTFELATENKYKGIVFAFQADMFHNPQQFTDQNSGYRDSLHAFSQRAAHYKKPVLLIHGDSHKLIIDQPLKSIDQKHYLENVIRLQVMGAEQVQAVEILVSPSSDQSFSFTSILIPQNRLFPSP